jgi:hypothetical protein
MLVDRYVKKIGDEFIDLSCENFKLRIIEIKYEGVKQFSSKI